MRLAVPSDVAADALPGAALTAAPGRIVVVNVAAPYHSPRRILDVALVQAGTIKWLQHVAWLNFGLRNFTQHVFNYRTGSQFS